MVTTRYATNRGIRLSYHLYDQWMLQRPRLVLIQGVGFDAAAWSPVLRHLRRRFRLVVLDNRGVGDSDAAHRWYSISTMVADVVAVLDAENIPAAHVLGVSLGGMVAQELAIRHPDRVDRLVLVSTTSGWPFSYPMPAPSARLLAVAPMLPRRIAHRRQAHTMMSRRSIAGQPTLETRMRAYLGSRQHAPRSSRLQMMAGATYVGGRRQLRIHAETLVLHGSADTVVDPRNATLLANRIPGATLVILPGAGHLLFWEDPDRFCDVVAVFLDRPVARRAMVAGEQSGEQGRRSRSRLKQRGLRPAAVLRRRLSRG